jgi:hypothetical protein
MGRDMLVRLTDGVYDPFSWYGVAEFAAPFAYHNPMYAQVFAPFGDVAFINSYIPDSLQSYMSYAFADNLPFKQLSHTPAPHLLAAFVLTYGFNTSTPLRQPIRVQQSDRTLVETTVTATQGLRNYDADSGVLTVRKVAGQSDGITATFKLGGNSKPTCASSVCQTHSHDDIGSYAIRVNGMLLSGDVGGPRRYASTDFTSTRYTSPVYNSWGHPVPMVNGKLQMRADLVWNQMLTNSSMVSSNVLARRLAASRKKMPVAVNKIQLPSSISPNFVFELTDPLAYDLVASSDSLPNSLGDYDVEAWDVEGIEDQNTYKSLFYSSDIKWSQKQVKNYFDDKGKGNKWKFEDFVKDDDYKDIVKGGINWNNPKYKDDQVSAVTVNFLTC